MKVSFHNKYQDIDDIEGQTLTLGADGSVQHQELRGDDIFTEEAGEVWKTSKFTLPALSPGCVIEYRYTIRSTNPQYLSDWSFQNDEPTLWSEYEIKTPNVFSYAYVSQGYHKYSLQTSEQVKEPFQGPAGTQIVDVSHSHWVMENLPALREEPFITTLDDYRDRVSFQLSGVNWPGEMPRQFLQSWAKVAEELWDHPGFGSQLSGSGSIRKAAESVLAGVTDPMKRMEALYDYVRTTIQWNERRDVVCRTSLDEVLEKKTGNSGDINLLLTAMLREAGIPAAPVLLSTRGNGKVVDIYPLLSQFNTVICQATVGGKSVLLDATERTRPWNLLPYADLNHRGYLVNDGKFSWVEVEPTATRNSLAFADISVDSTGAVAGKVQMKFSDYAAVGQRSDLASGKREEFVKGLMKSASLGVAVDSFSITNADSVMLPLVVEAIISSPNYAQALNDFIYVNPMTVSRSMENPFKRPDRLFPVDYAYQRSFNYRLNLKLPPGYVLKEYPKDMTMQLPMNGGVYQRSSQLAENVYMLSVKFNLTQISFPAKLYYSLREFYERIVALESEQLVLERERPAAPAAAAPPPAPAKKKGKK